jgi:hypothetical protein
MLNTETKSLIEVIKNYEIPGLGRAEIFHDASEKRLHGDYFARVSKYGIAGRYSSSLEEAENNMLEAMKHYLTRKNEELEQEKTTNNEGLEFIAGKIEENNYAPEVNSEGGNK